MDRQDIRQALEKLADPKLKVFSEALIPGAKNILGVRIPQLRALAKSIAKNNWEHFIADEICDDSFEEITLQGLVLGYAKMSPAMLEKELVKVIPKIDNWATCDVVCSTLVVVRKSRERTWKFLMPYLRSRKEFEVRFGVIMLLAHFLVPAEIARVFAVLNKIRNDGYYAKMGVAWAIATAYAKFPQESEAFLKNNALDDWTFKKTIQKICESRRVSATEKTRLRAVFLTPKKTDNE